MKFLFFVILVILLWVGYELCKPTPVKEPPTPEKISALPEQKKEPETDKQISKPEAKKITPKTKPQISDTDKKNKIVQK